MKSIELNRRTKQIFSEGIAKRNMLVSQLNQLDSQLQRDLMVIAESHYEIEENEEVSLSDDGKTIEIKPSAEK
jgi:hypothetical protein